MCQYNNINVNLHQYLKEKKYTNRLLKRKKKGGTHETKALLQLQYAHNAKAMDVQCQDTVPGLVLLL